jgi:hypothetical protein
MWEKPELVVLLRSKPEEAVLAPCKGGVTTGPRLNDGSCFGIFIEFCSDCLSRAAS